MVRRAVLFLIFTITIGMGCQPKERTVETSFYYWKQTFQVNDFEQSYLTDLGVRKLYIKLFDISWSFTKNQPAIVAPIRFKASPSSNIEIIPTVFITNQTMVQLSDEKIEDLANLVIKTIEAAAQSQNISFKGIQIDCDWTLSTRDKYFDLLAKIKTQLPNQELSATIRLHQIKFYKKTGIPPVDRGLLMFYNMDAVTDSTTQNSILDLDVARQYFYNFDEYSLPLDIGLPVFRWGVVTRRGRVVQLINHLDEKDIFDTSKYKANEDHRFQVVQSHYLKGFYLYAGDKIRLESVSLPDLRESAALLNDIVQQDTLMNVIYYHLDSTALQHYSTKEIQSITNQFLK